MQECKKESELEPYVPPEDVDLITQYHTVTLVDFFVCLEARVYRYVHRPTGLVPKDKHRAFTIKEAIELLGNESKEMDHRQKCTKRWKKIKLQMFEFGEDLSEDPHYKALEAFLPELRKRHCHFGGKHCGLNPERCPKPEAVRQAFRHMVCVEADPLFVEGCLITYLEKYICINDFLLEEEENDDSLN